MDVVEDRIIIYKQTKQNIKEQLEIGNFPLIHDSYDYLLKLPIYSLTKEEIDKLLKEKDGLTKQHTELSVLSAKDMWLGELTTFEKEYSKFLKK